MQDARVCLAPLRFGAGLKGKLIESMLTGTPSVTTGIGAEAMHAELPWNGCITDDTDKFILEAANLYLNEADWQQAQINGISIINSVFNRVENAQGMVNRINEIRNNIESHRLNNFTGAMLKHHLLKSTEYMSRWIEAKNKLQVKT